MFNLPQSCNSHRSNLSFNPPLTNPTATSPKQIIKTNSQLRGGSPNTTEPFELSKKICSSFNPASIYPAGRCSKKPQRDNKPRGKEAGEDGEPVLVNRCNSSHSVKRVHSSIRRRGTAWRETAAKKEQRSERGTKINTRCLVGESKFSLIKAVFLKHTWSFASHRVVCFLRGTVSLGRGWFNTISRAHPTISSPFFSPGRSAPPTITDCSGR